VYTSTVDGSFSGCGVREKSLNRFTVYCRIQHMTKTQAATATLNGVAGDRRRLLPARAGAETQELTTRIILHRIHPGRPEPRAFRFQRSVSDERNGRWQQLRGTDCQAWPVLPCAGARAPTRPRARSASCSWARCSFPPRQKHAPNRCAPPASPAARAGAETRHYRPTPACRFRGHPHRPLSPSLPASGGRQASAAGAGLLLQGAAAPRSHQKKPRAGREQGPCVMRGTLP
jgi:hypothetical protein